MLKLLGAVLVLFAATMAGIQWSRRYANRPAQIRSLRSALQRLETEIGYGSTPLPIALNQIAQQAPSPISELFSGVVDRLIQQPDDSLLDSWREGLSARWENTVLRHSEKEILLHFGTTLGSSDREDQIKHIRLVIANLLVEEENAREEQSKYEKLCKSLGVLAGALAVILMF